MFAGLSEKDPNHWAHLFPTQEPEDEEQAEDGADTTDDRASDHARVDTALLLRLVALGP